MTSNDGIGYKILFVIMILVPIIMGYLAYLLCLFAWFILRQPVQNTDRDGRTLALRVAPGIPEEAVPPSVGLEPSAITSLPMFLCSDSAAECPICLGVLGDGDKTQILPNCKHPFHAGCIGKWLGTNSTCPICRACITPSLQL
ncbi:hypothetical protein MLD38_030565 [Melastoma candidum]|uniref:Uncharacterized protein n=1 Tax=Melastoma candidum TaxID=119954 RepID=A0ACB9MNK2_9MYRT|nr:hypothetical protein MLD38_030565 [Melastoma candidum]